MADSTNNDNQNAVSRCSQTAQLAAVHPGVRWYYNRCLFWKGFNAFASIAFFSLIVLGIWNAVMFQPIMFFGALIYCLCLSHTIKMYKLYSWRARSLKHNTWVLNHIPPMGSEIIVHSRRDIWFSQGMIISVWDETHDKYLTYELMGSSKDFEDTLHTGSPIQLYEDPLTKRPAALEVDGKAALLRPTSERG